MCATVEGPKVSVLMGVYNGSPYLREAIDSILGQTFEDFEFLIIDDGSTDDSVEIIRSYSDPRIKLHLNDGNIGLTKSLNVGLSLARGELIARQDADDISLPNRFTKQVEFMDQHAEVSVLGAQVQLIDETSRPINRPTWKKLSSPIGLKWQSMFDSPFIHSSVMMRHAVVWQKENGYDENFRTSQDFELWSRLSEKYLLQNLADTLLKFRQCENSVSKGYKPEMIEKVSTLFVSNINNNTSGFFLAPQWAKAWNDLNNQKVCAVTSNPKEAISCIKGIYNGFCLKYSETKEMPEIKRHLAGIFIRCFIAYRGNKRKGMIWLLIKALKTRPIYTITTVFKLVIYKIKNA